MSAAIPTLVLNRFRGDFGCDFAGALRLQIASNSILGDFKRCDSKSLRMRFVIWASKLLDEFLVPHLRAPL